MRAIVFEEFGGPDVLSVVDVPEPSPGPGQLTIDVAWAGVNFADVKARSEGYRVPGLPFHPGLDVSGTVREVAGDVTGLRARPGGRRVPRRRRLRRGRRRPGRHGLRAPRGRRPAHGRHSAQRAAHRVRPAARGGPAPRGRHRPGPGRGRRRRHGARPTRPRGRRVGGLRRGLQPGQGRARPQVRLRPGVHGRHLRRRHTRRDRRPGRGHRPGPGRRRDLRAHPGRPRPLRTTGVVRQRRRLRAVADRARRDVPEGAVRLRLLHPRHGRGRSGAAARDPRPGAAHSR